MHRERSNQFLRSSDTDLRIDIASDPSYRGHHADCCTYALLRCKKIGESRRVSITALACWCGDGCCAAVTSHDACTVIAHCNSCQGRKCGVAATPVVDFQQYFSRFARPILDAWKAAEIHCSPMRIGVDRVSRDGRFGHFRHNSAWANPVTDVRRACHDY